MLSTCAKYGPIALLFLPSTMTKCVPTVKTATIKEGEKGEKAFLLNLNVQLVTLPVNFKKSISTACLMAYVT